MTTLVLAAVLAMGAPAGTQRAPAFAKNLVRLLVGPLWIANDMVKVVR